MGCSGLPANRVEAYRAGMTPISFMAQEWTPARSLGRGGRTAPYIRHPVGLLMMTSSTQYFGLDFGCAHWTRTQEIRGPMHCRCPNGVEHPRWTLAVGLLTSQWGHASKVNSGRQIRNAPTGHCIPAQGNALGPEDPTSRVLKERRIFRDRRPALFRCGVPSERIVFASYSQGCTLGWYATPRWGMNSPATSPCHSPFPIS